MSPLLVFFQETSVVDYGTVALDLIARGAHGLEVREMIHANFLQFLQMSKRGE
jgi:hypothetical protein